MGYIPPLTTSHIIVVRPLLISGVMVSNQLNTFTKPTDYMAAYFMNSYDIVDEQQFSQYAPQVIPLLKKYGAEVVAADVEGIAMEGKPRKMNAIIRFPSVEVSVEMLSRSRIPTHESH